MLTPKTYDAADISYVILNKLTKLLFKEHNPVGFWPWMASIGHFENNTWKHECLAQIRFVINAQKQVTKPKGYVAALSTLILLIRS